MNYQLLLMAAGLIAVLVLGYLALAGPSAAKAGQRRLQSLRFRHSDNTIDKVAEQAKPVVEKVASSVHEGVDQVGEKITQVSDTVAKASERLLERGKQLGAVCQKAGESGRGYVRERPGVSLLIAAAAGYGLSKLLSSRK